MRLNQGIYLLVAWPTLLFVTTSRADDVALQNATAAAAAATVDATNIVAEPRAPDVEGWPQGGDIVDLDTKKTIEEELYGEGSAREEIYSSKNDQQTESDHAKLSQEQPGHPPMQSGPLIDLFGPALLSLGMLDDTHAQLQPHYTSDALRNKKVIGVYFSADWCGPCRQFTPELVSFYNKMNARRGKKDEFEIVWVSRCRDMDSFGQYFTHMGSWYALPPEDAMGARGEMLAKMYNVKGIPTLILLNEIGHVITTDARNKIPQDKAGVGFPWRNPLATLYMTLFPRTLRIMVKSQVTGLKNVVLQRVKQVLVPKKSIPA